MKPSPVHRPSAGLRLPYSAFTLVELLTVVAIMAVLLAVASPVVFRMLQGNQLATAGEHLINQLALAQQMAASGNHPVEVRFYRYQKADGLATAPYFHAYQVFRFFDVPQPDPADPSGPPITEKPLGNLVMLGSGVVVSGDPALTPFAAGALSPDGGKHLRTEDAEYFACRYYPNGTTNLPKTVSASHLTLVSESDAEAGSSPPANFYTIQIDPYTGRLKAYRP